MATIVGERASKCQIIFVGRSCGPANRMHAHDVSVAMGSSRSHRVPRLLVLALAITVAVLGILLGPPATFHLLPPGITGEEARLATVLGIRPGQTVAEIGAGRGALSVALAKRLEPDGLLYSTELDPDRRTQIRTRADREGISNLVVIEASATHTGLPEACCDVVFMRNVYHHITDPDAFTRSIRQAIRPGGLLAIIDFAPGTFWHLREPASGAPRERTGHGVGPQAVAAELERAGFRLERVEEDWGGWLYLVLMRAEP